jgi:L-rhamnose-H+ transport protein
MNETATGLCLLFLAGAMNGSFALPMKFTHKWAWENTWLVWTICALFVLPTLLAYWTVPELFSVYRQTSAPVVLAVAVCGAGWGVSQVLFGLAVDAIGMGLSFSIVLGVSAAVGSAIPLVQLHPDKIATFGGVTVISGVLLVLGGVATCAAAGKRRELALGTYAKSGRPMAKGILFSVLSGTGGALLNVGLAYGAPLLRIAQNNGAPEMWGANAVLLPVMVAGGVSNLAYCVYLMRKKRSGGRFLVTGTGSYWLLAALMAVFWFGSTAIYGAATVKLGELGTVFAWPAFMSLIVIAAVLWGVVTGEWANAGRKPVRMMGVGVLMLIFAIVFFGLSSRML